LIKKLRFKKALFFNFKKEALYEKYKEGLKLLSKQDFHAAETVFEILIKNPLLESVRNIGIKSNYFRFFKQTYFFTH
jgi:hypothetical protein